MVRLGLASARYLNRSISNMFDVDRSGAVNVLDTNSVRAASGTSSLWSFTAPDITRVNRIAVQPFRIAPRMAVEQAMADQYFVEFGTERIRRRNRMF